MNALVALAKHGAIRILSLRPIKLVLLQKILTADVPKTGS